MDHSMNRSNIQKGFKNESENFLIFFSTSRKLKKSEIFERTFERSEMSDVQNSGKVTRVQKCQKMGLKPGLEIF